MDMTGGKKREGGRAGDALRPPLGDRHKKGGG